MIRSTRGTVCGTLLALAFAGALAAPAAAQTPLRTWCMDGWAGELCFDVVTFELNSTLTIGGYWRGSGYPADFRDWLGRGPSAGVTFFGAAGSYEFINTDTRYVEWTRLSNVYLGDVDEFGQGYEEGYHRQVVDMNAITHLDIGTGGHYAACHMPSVAPRVDIPQACRVVGVPEPSSLLLLASGMFGLAYVRRRRVTS